MDDQAKQTEEVRVDEHALMMFASMGYDRSRLPDSLVRYYNAFKRKKDIMAPGRLSAEGFAFVAILSELTEGNLEPEKSTKK